LVDFEPETCHSGEGPPKGSEGRGL
jgi:hypothetical protein